MPRLARFLAGRGGARLARPILDAVPVPCPLAARASLAQLAPDRTSVRVLSTALV